MSRIAQEILTLYMSFISETESTKSILASLLGRDSWKQNLTDSGV